MLPQLVLIVVNDRAIRQSYKQFLVPRGFVVEEAVDGSEALAKAISDPPDIIVTERDLPSFSGEQLCRMLKQDRDTRRVPVVLLADDAVAVDVAVFGFAADSVLTKPCAPETLLAEMKRVADRSAELRAGARLARSAARRRVGPSGDVIQASLRVAAERTKPPQ
jgi:two-component system alkaline phosphatase synthesis response regulator PhoP